MGLLNEGKITPLSWEEIQKWSSHVKNSGIEQFISLYKRFSDRDGDPLKWGEEIEYLIIRFDHENKRAQVSLRADQLLPVLRQPEFNDPESVKTLWRPEYSSFMLEGSPGKPYDSRHLKQVNIVEAHMKSRRKEVQLHLPPNETILSIANFPRLGCPGFTHPEFNPQPKSKSSITESIFIADETICSYHPRFAALAQNIKLRRGSKPIVHIPIFKDEQTPNPFIDFGLCIPDAKPDFVYTDASAFGVSCCSIQVTVQAANMGEARLLYDNLAPLCPILLALTSAVPFFRGYLVDVNNRWGVISAGADDRTPSELKKIPKSRYDGIGCYVSKDGADYNDIPVPFEETHYRKLLDGGVDPEMAQHIAHLFVRDPVVLYREKVHQDNSKDTDHFENLLSSNWQTMRLKTPCPLADDCGWRVEVRPCEVQLTDFENAAIAYLILLLSRIIVTFGLCFLIPMSKLDENMIRAQSRDAVLYQKFWFRSNIFNKQDKSYTLMTVNDIFNGSQKFPGLIPLIQAYLNSRHFDGDAESFHILQEYLSLVSKRASGEIKTTAAWLRSFITSHPAYKKDSVISDEINYDLLQRISRLQEDPDSSLLGDFLSKTKNGFIK